MFRAFRERRPWAAAVICFIFGPELGMLYLNEGWYAVIYWLIAVILAIAILAFWPNAVAIADIPFFVSLISLPLRLISAVHGFLLAMRRQYEAKLKWYAHWYGAIILSYVLPLMLAFGTRTFLYRSFDSPSASMIPTINVGDYFFVSRFSYDFVSPQRGDVVVFYVPAHKSYFVKRVIGLPGDRVQMKHGQLLLNGARIPIRRMDRVAVPCVFGPSCQTVRYEEIYPNGKSVPIVDQVAEGPQDNTGVFAVPNNSYFVLGDNRDDSMDSREEAIGFVPRGAIMGKVAYKYFAAGRWSWQLVH